MKKLRGIIASLLLLTAPLAESQVFDDYSDFSADPILLDEEVRQAWGRFFQTNFLLGTGVFTGDLGAANSAGFMVGLRFVFFFDRVWGLEMGGGYGRHTTLYDQNNTNTNGINISMNTHLIPINLGLRFGIDQDSLPAGIAAMNPYLSIGGQLMSRSERIVGTPTTSGLTSEAQKFAENDIISTTALGMTFGAGFEFDVYRNQVFLGLDLRYNWIFWPDSSIRLGDPATSGSTADALERNGALITILGSLTYNY